MENDELEKALGNLSVKDEKSKNDQSKARIQSLRQELKDNETCYKWVNELPTPVTDEELRVALAVYTAQFEDFSQRDYDNESDLQYSAVETVSKRCLQAQIQILLKNYDEVPSITAETYHLIKDCIEKKYISQVYGDGLRYVVRSLEIENAVEETSFSLGKNTASKAFDLLPEHLDEIKKYKTLDSRNKAVVLGLKQYFLGNIRRDLHVHQIEVIKKIIKIDPENPEWHCCLFSVLKFKQEFDTYRAPPSEEIIQALVNGLDSDPRPIKDPRLQLGFIAVLAELLKHNIRNFTTLSCGRQTFSDPEEVVDYIQNEADNILGVDPMSVRSNINIAKIFSSTLPKDFQKRDFAQACIKRALLFHPNSSKANHRMGVFYLFGSKDQALKYFQKAFACDDRNYFCIHDLIHTYLSDISKHRKEIDAVFDKMLSSKYYSSMPKQLAEFMFLKAIYKFLDGKPSESIDLFVTGVTLSPKSKDKFKELRGIINRHNWAHTTAESLLAGIRNELEKNYMCQTEQKRKQILKDLLDAVSRAETKFPGAPRGGGGSRFHHSGGPFRGHENTFRSGSGYTRGRGFNSSRGFGGTNRGFNSQSGFGGHNSWRDSNTNNNHNHHQKQDWREKFSQGWNQGRQGAGAGDGNRKQNEDKESEANKFLKTQDHWVVLGVTRTATRAEIKKAYFKLAQAHHPDKNMDLSPTELLKKQEQMKLINKAYECLYK